MMTEAQARSSSDATVLTVCCDLFGELSLRKLARGRESERTRTSSSKLHCPRGSTERGKGHVSVSIQGERYLTTVRLQAQGVAVCIDISFSAEFIFSHSRCIPFLFRESAPRPCV